MGNNFYFLRREFYVKELLGRYCHKNEENSLAMSKEEALLVNKFNVPVQWLHEAKVCFFAYKRRSLISIDV